MEHEIKEGFGTLYGSEPTTLCDISNTLSYVEKVTPVVEKVQKLLEEYKYYTGTFDEEGRFKAGCLRLKGSYTQLYTPEEATDWNVRTTLGYQLWDAHVDYGRLVPELSEKLKQLHDELGEEGKELR